jgi:membrane-associated progesterone receptor component
LLHFTCNITDTDIAVFTGKDASRALAQSSLKPEEARPEWEDLSDEHKKVLDDWFTFFSKRYNIVGKVARDEKL